MDKPRVKPLEWEEFSETTWRSDGYVLRETHINQFTLSYLSEVIGEYSGGASRRFAIKEANKHHEARILAALEPVTVQEAARVALERFESCASKMVPDEYAKGYREACEHIRALAERGE